MVNKVILVGNLAQDMELKMSQSQTVYANNSVAVDQFYNNEKKTEWINVVFFGKVASNLAKYAKKGSRVYVEGRIKTESYFDEKIGQKKYSTKVIASNALVLDKKTTQNEYVEQNNFEQEIPF